MLSRILTLSLIGLLAGASGALAQSAPSAPQAPSAPAAPKIRRWVDVQQLHLSSRFRWYESSAGEVKSSNLQYQPLVRARFLFDAQARYSVQVHAASGATLVSGWNNTGGGMGEFAGVFSVKQLYFAAEPVKGLEFQVGSLYMNRGEVTENVSYDNDTYVTGERVTWRPSKGRLTQLSAITGYFGEYREPNFFQRADRLGDWNYGQVLAGFRVASRVQASVDYTYEDGRDILREGVTVRMPEKTKLLTSVKVESYQRLENENGRLLNKAGAGFNVAGDLRIQKLTVTAGVMSVDRFYGPYNGDRYEVGTRFYYYGTYPVTRDFSVGWFHGEAFATDYLIPNKHRFEIIATINPTASLKRAGIF